MLVPAPWLRQTRTWAVPHAAAVHAHLGDGCCERGLAMIYVADRSDVHMRLAARVDVIVRC